MSLATFKIDGRLDGADGGKLMIHRESGLIAVRPKGRHRVYELNMLDVAMMIIERVVRAEMVEKQQDGSATDGK